MTARTKDRVVVGVDGSASSEAALRWAEGYAVDHGLRLELVTAWQHPVWYGVPMMPSDWAPDLQAAEVLEKAAASLTLPEDQVDKRPVQGLPGPVLVGAAKDAALLVVGSHGHGAVAGALLGSVSSYCTHHATCPAVVVR